MIHKQVVKELTGHLMQAHELGVKASEIMESKNNTQKERIENAVLAAVVGAISEEQMHAKIKRHLNPDEKKIYEKIREAGFLFGLTTSPRTHQKLTIEKALTTGPVSRVSKVIEPGEDMPVQADFRQSHKIQIDARKLESQIKGTVTTKTENKEKPNLARAAIYHQSRLTENKSRIGTITERRLRITATKPKEEVINAILSSLIHEASN